MGYGKRTRPSSTFVQNQTVSYILARMDEIAGPMIEPLIPTFDAHAIYAKLVPSPDVRTKLIAAGEFIAPTVAEFRTVLSSPQATNQVRVYLRGDAECHYFMTPDRKYQADYITDEALSEQLEPYLRTRDQWNELRFTFKALFEHLGTEQLNYFFPWLADLLRLRMDKLNETDNMAVARWLAPVLEGRKPKRIPSMPRHLFDICRSGGQLLAQYLLLKQSGHQPISPYNDDDLPPGRGCVAIRLDPTVPVRQELIVALDEWQNHMRRGGLLRDDE